MSAPNNENNVNVFQQAVLFIAACVRSLFFTIAACLSSLFFTIAACLSSLFFTIAA
jgi:hypothetical protein